MGFHSVLAANARAPTRGDPRRRSVIDLARRCNWHRTHSEKVADLTLQLFDELKSLHGLGASERSEDPVLRGEEPRPERLVETFDLARGRRRVGAGQEVADAALVAAAACRGPAHS